MDENKVVNRLVTERWVRIMGDNGCDAVWDKDECAVSVDDLPVANGLRREILDWQLEYSRLWDLYHEVEIADWPASNWHAFSVQGLQLAKAVKAQLPDWTVIFVDKEKYTECCVDYPKTPKPRSYYEFAIVL